MSALKDRKVDIPDQVAVVTCEAVQLTQHLQPGLTTAGVAIDAQCEVMAGMLIDEIEGRSLSRPDLLRHLNVRESSSAN
ncbi:substrate-binding domain-containing protein [Pseudarthrobacter sp. AL07]|uniref:substrate-binding domain-containing protein n=1 Tax=Pseudarthrobacter sp. AL07 TaxID=3042233 RepID=UPI00249C6D6F|nr:substrate-binding domain-containing protein [Pseudarthrobacter sp. AL07]